MPDLLIELRSEEIPARMQRKAAGDLKALVTGGLVAAGLTYEGAREYWTPRRLALDIRGVDAASKAAVEERKGPRTDAPAKAIDGFLKAAGLASVDEAAIRRDAKKGDFYVAIAQKAGRPAQAIVAEMMPAILAEFPWPKSMRWGPASRRPGSFRWVRPLQSILCTFGPESGEPAVVDFEIGGIRSGNVTYGHRFHAPEPIVVRRFEDYAASLQRAFVVLDAERRKAIIRTDAQTLAFARGLDIVADEALLEEVAGLVEWPVVLVGAFEAAFLAIPPEVVRLTIKTNQKCFVARPAGGEGLTNAFFLVANIEASDGGAEIARGNGKVVRARLSDALYFWRTDQGDLPDLGGLTASAEALGLDLAKPLDQRMAKLDALGVTFHARLGTQGERVRRIASLAETIAPQIGADPALARRAALLAKADLTSEAVGEFPELQGLMGRYYAGLQGEPASVQIAIEEHYKPQGPGDAVPRDPVAIAVALADKLDTLTGFWAIDEKPTGSKDPYALRRAALGVIRIVLANRLRLDFLALIGSHGATLTPAVTTGGAAPFDLLSFFHDRLKVQLRDEGARHDLVDAVLSSKAAHPSSGPSGHFLPAGETNAALADERPSSPLRRDGAERREADEGHEGQAVGAAAMNSDLLDIVRRVEALGAFLETEEGRNLLAGVRRAANILAAEEKKGTPIAPAALPSLFAAPEETALAAAIDRADAAMAAALEAEDHGAALAALARLRAPVDAFFDAVLVNAEDGALRANRLALLARIRSATLRVADMTRIQG